MAYCIPEILPLCYSGTHSPSACKRWARKTWPPREFLCAWRMCIRLFVCVRVSRESSSFHEEPARRRVSPCTFVLFERNSVRSLKSCCTTSRWIIVGFFILFERSRCIVREKWGVSPGFFNCYFNNINC